MQHVLRREHAATHATTTRKGAVTQVFAAVFGRSTSLRVSRYTLGSRARHFQSPCLPLRDVRVRSLDYVATSTDEGVLRLPPRQDLSTEQITHVFGFSRNIGSKYFLGRVIGAGSFGVVRECMEIGTARRFAVKTIGKMPKRGAATPRYLLKLRTEVEIMQQLGYSLDAVNLKDVYEDDQSIHLVMELCEGGALLERIERIKYCEAYVAKLTRSILRFISQCHAKGIIYRDVKPDNFLFLTNDDDSPLKATDFGLSIRHWPEEPKLTSRSGTPAYMAPELVMQHYDEKCDVWSVGMLVYQLLTGRFPFWEDVRKESLSDVWAAILSRDINWKAAELRNLSPGAVSFLQSLLHRNSEERPSAKAALEHPWLADKGAAATLPLAGSVVQRLQRFSTYGHLKQAVLRMIAEEIACEDATLNSDASDADSAAADVACVPLAEIPTAAAKVNLSDLKALFEQLDADHSGSVSLDELSQGLKQQGYVLADHELEQLMRKIDSDHNQTIDMTEFLTTLIDWNRMQKELSWQTYVDHAFARLDHDGDGFISLDELLDQLPPASIAGGEAAEAERKAEAKLMLREADTNGDGKISKQEFCDLLWDNHAPDSLSFYDDRLALHMGTWNGQLSSQSTTMSSSGSVSNFSKAS